MRRRASPVTEISVSTTYSVKDLIKKCSSALLKFTKPTARFWKPSRKRGIRTLGFTVLRRWRDAFWSTIVGIKRYSSLLFLPFLVVSGRFSHVVLASFFVPSRQRIRQLYRLTMKLRCFPIFFAVFRYLPNFFAILMRCSATPNFSLQKMYASFRCARGFDHMSVSDQKWWRHRKDDLFDVSRVL